MLKDVLKSQRILLERSVRATKIVERERKIHKTKLVKVITGIRRCGKSFFTYLYLSGKNFCLCEFR